MSSWARDFRQALARYGRLGNPAPVIRIESFTPWPGGADASRSGMLALCSAPVRLAGYPVIRKITLDSGRLSLRSWSTSLGSITVECSSEGMDRWMDAAEIGTCVRVMMGFAGWAPDQFELVGFGPIQNVVTDADRVTLEIGGPQSLLGARWDDGNDQHAILSSRGSTTLTANYTAGVSAALVTVSTADLDRQAGESWMVRVTPTTGSPFYNRISAKTATNLTIAAENALGSTSVDAVIGDAVTEVLYIPQHPIEATLSILLSTGASGRNHANYDDLHAFWAFGLNHDLVNVLDAESWVGRSQPAAGSDDWQIYTPTPQADGFSWLSGILGPGGFFLCCVEGRLSVRAIVDPHQNWTSGRTLDLERCLSIRLQHADDGAPVEYDRLGITAADGTTDESAAEAQETMPAERVYDLQCDYIFSNAANWIDGLLDRLAPWYQRVPSLLDVRLSAEWATLSVGDVLHIQGNAAMFGIRGRTKSTRESIWDGVPGTVIQSKFDPLLGIVDVSIAILPNG